MSRKLTTEEENNDIGYNLILRMAIPISISELPYKLSPYCLLITRITPDDQRFLMLRLAVGAGGGGDGGTRYILVQNFFEELRERVGN